MLVRAGRRQVWHLMRAVLLLAVPLALVGVVGAVVRPEALETWAGAAISAALLLVLMGLGSALLRRVSTGRHRVVDTGSGLRLVRWWGTHEVPWAEVRRVDVEDGAASALWDPVDAPPRAVFVDRGGRRWRVPLPAVGGELAIQRQRLAVACAAHGVEVRGAAVGSGERRRALGGGRA